MSSTMSTTVSSKMSLTIPTSNVGVQQVTVTAASMENQSSSTGSIPQCDGVPNYTRASITARGRTYLTVRLMPDAPTSRVRHRSNAAVEHDKHTKAVTKQVDALIAEQEPKSPVPANLDEWLSPKDDNLCALPTTAKYKIKTPDYPEYNGFPLLVSKVSKPEAFHDLEQKAPWMPFRDGASALMVAHVDHTTRYSTAPSLKVSPQQHGVQNLPHPEERSWTRAKMSKRLNEDYAARMREWQRRNAEWEELQSADESIEQEPKATSESSDTSLSTPALTSGASNTSISTPELTALPSHAPILSDIEQSDWTLDPLRRIIREENKEFFASGNAGLKPAWAKRGGPPDEHTRAAQEKVFGFAQRFWEHIEGRPMQTPVQPLKPLWASKHAEKEAKNTYGAYEDSSDSLRSSNAKNGQTSKWQTLVGKFKQQRTEDDHESDDQILQPGEEFDMLQVDHDTLDDIFDEPDAPIGIFDPAEVAYWADRERRKKVEELKTQGAKAQQLEDFHRDVFGVSAKEIEGPAEEARKALVESGKLLPKPVPKKRKRGVSE